VTTFDCHYILSNRRQGEPVRITADNELEAAEDAARRANIPYSRIEVWSGPVRLLIWKRPRNRAEERIAG
jgi:hypothetical protein